MLDSNFMVLDTETANSLDDPLCYDIGFTVLSPEFEILETRSYVVADIFLDHDLMKSAYFAEKIPQYWDDIKAKKRDLRRLKTIRFALRDICKEYGVTKIFAHNACFDNRSLNTTQRYMTSSKYRYFLPYGVEWWDSLKMARKVLKDDDDYGKFCYENGYLTKRGCRRYTAEIIYQYLTNNTEFSESHTGLEDVMIEKEIVKFCMTKEPEIDGRLWSK